MSEPVHCLVFTKDRPLQLDAFLRSAELYAPYESITVLCAGEDASEEYMTCRRENGRRHWWWLQDEPEGFAGHVLRFLGSYRRVVFHTDDEIWFRRPPAELLELDSSQVVVTFRQGRNTVWCHPLASPQRVPDRFPWRWRDAELDFAYPLSLNACVYHSRDLLPLIDFRFENPTQLEAQLAANAARFTVEWMTAPERSCTVCLPWNLVSVSSGNPYGGPSAGELLDLYRRGYRIDLDRLDYSRVNAAHVELDPVFT